MPSVRTLDTGMTKKDATKQSYLPHLPPQIRSAWARYSFAILTFGAAFAARHVADPWLAEDHGLIVFLPAIAVTILFAGSKAGTVTAVLSLAAICYFFVHPVNSLEMALVELGNVLAYVFAAGAIGLIVHWLRVSILELEAERARSELLRHELQHRVKNLFGVVHALASRTLRGSAELERPRETFLGRLHALARANELITDAAKEKVILADIVRDELTPFLEQVVIDGPEVGVDMKQAQDFALVIHELATNAAKYGALSVPGGQVHVLWSVAERDREALLKFGWSEHGGPRAEAPKRQGFGTYLLGAALGPGKTEFSASGLRFDVEVLLISPRS